MVPVAFAVVAKSEAPDTVLLVAVPGVIAEVFDNVADDSVLFGAPVAFPVVPKSFTPAVCVVAAVPAVCVVFVLATPRVAVAPSMARPEFAFVHVGPVAVPGVCW